MLTTTPSILKLHLAVDIHRALGKGYPDETIGTGAGCVEQYGKPQTEFNQFAVSTERTSKT